MNAVRSSIVTTWIPAQRAPFRVVGLDVEVRPVRAEMRDSLNYHGAPHIRTNAPATESPYAASPAKNPSASHLTQCRSRQKT